MKRILYIILALMVLPLIASAQIERVWGTLEYSSIVPNPPATGAKLAYRNINNSLYYWNGSIWVRIAGPGIIDTSYSLSFSSPNLSLVGSGSSVNLTNLYTAGYGLIKTGEAWRADTTSPNGLATKIFTNRFLLKSDTTTFLAPYIDGSGTITRIPIFTGARTIGNSNALYNSTTKRWTWDSPGTIELPMGTDAQRPASPTMSDMWYNTTSNGIEWYNGTRWAKGLESTFNTGTSGRFPRFDANGQVINSVLSEASGVVSLVGSAPFALGQWTTAGRPAGVSGYMGYNTSDVIPEWYNGTTWDQMHTPWTVSGTTTSIPFTTSSSAIVFTPSSAFATGTFGFNYFNNNAYDFGMQNGAKIRWQDAGGGIATMSGSWNFPANATYPANAYLAGSSGGSNDVRWVISRSGTGASQTIYAYTQRNSVADNAPRLYQGASSFAWGTRNNTTPWNNSADSTKAFMATSGDFWLGNASYGGLGSYPSITTQARLNIIGRGTATTYPLLLLENLGGTDRFAVLENGKVSIAKTVPDYIFDVTSTDAFGLPRGTVAQRPTIVSSTTPFRYNTDSTALEYGESVGVWRQLATRAYARSLISALPTTNIYTADGTLTSNRTLTSGGFNLRLNTDVSIGSSSAPVRKLDVTGEVRISDLTTDAPTRIVGADADGDLGDLSLSGGLSFPSSGVLSSKWLGTELPIGDVQIGAANNSLRLNSLDTMKMNHAIITTPGTTNLLLLNPNVGSTGYPGNLGGGFHTVLNGTMATTNAGTGHIVIGGTVNNGLGANFGVALGYAANIGSNQGVAIGYDADATGIDNSMAIGYGARADESYEITLGSSNYTKLNLWATGSLGRIEFGGYGVNAKNATTLTKTLTNQNAAFATDGTVLEIERKRDTTIYVTDSDYNFSAAITTAQIAARYNRIVFFVTTTLTAISDSDITFHTPDVNLIQCEYLLRSTDGSVLYDNEMLFGTNNAVSSDGSLVSGYSPAAGQGVGMRVGLQGGVYKYFYY